MYNNPFYSQSFNLDRLNRMKDDIEKQIQTCQSHQQPINNFINTNQPQSNLFELKKLNDGDEVENIFTNNDAIFIGNNRMQIKKLDGTIEKYNIEKYYPIDEKDEQIKLLNKKVEELAHEIVEDMKPKGEYWDMETIKNVVGAIPNLPEIYVVMNSLVNDYGDVISPENVETYVKMTNAWINDVDGHKNKVWWYFIK